MSQSNDDASAAADAPWKSGRCPCVYCGRTIPRDARRCPECRTSFSLAVRKAYREAVGEWFYLDQRNPSGRGVTFETLVKLIEKGRLQPDSVVRGPATHQDWMYAAETPRLAKYLGICPHCFAETSPDHTYCPRCQLNMNERPATPRPGVPANLVKAPHHKPAHEQEKELARQVAASQEAKVDVLAPAKAPTPVAAGAAMRAPAESKTRVSVAIRKRRPRIWIVLLLTWITLVPLFIISLVVEAPSGCEKYRHYQDRWRAMFDLGPDPAPTPPPVADPVLQQWLEGQLEAADRATEAGDFEAAIAIYRKIIERTDDNQWTALIRDLTRRIHQRDEQRLDGLRQKLSEADRLARGRQYDDALAILRNIGMEDRLLIAARTNVSVEKMETQVRQDREAYRQEQALVRQRLTAALDQAAKLKADSRLREALGLYEQIAQTFPRDMVARQVDIDEAIRDLRAEIAAAPQPPVPPQPPQEPPLTEQETISKVAGLIEEAVKLEQEEDFAGALEKLNAVKEFDPKYWPPSLDKRIETVKKKKAALDFFGLDQAP